MTTTTKTIEIDNVQARFMLFSQGALRQSNAAYVVSAEHMDTLDRLNHWPNMDTKSVEYYEDSSDGKFFAFANVDCFNPPMTIIRADSFESAYEVFCDEFSRWMAIGETDLADYDPETMNYSASGVPIDTDNVTGFEVQLMSIEC